MQQLHPFVSKVRLLSLRLEQPVRLVCRLFTGGGKDAWRGDGRCGHWKTPQKAHVSASLLPLRFDTNAPKNPSLSTNEYRGRASYVRPFVSHFVSCGER
jgi:hypothetical protein